MRSIENEVNAMQRPIKTDRRPRAGFKMMPSRESPSLTDTPSMPPRSSPP